MKKKNEDENKKKEEPVSSQPGDKKKKIFIVLFIVLGIIVAWGGVVYAVKRTAIFNGKGISAFNWLSENSDRIKKLDEAKQDENKLVPRAIDGMMVEKEKQNPWLVAVMIENLATTAVRPQSGLSSFPVVYETLAEGGITRFVGIFNGQDAKEIGPVRSARPYYVEIGQEYDALYDHAGGSPQALSDIQKYGVHDLNALGNGARFHWRDRSKSAPHNLYSNSEKLSLAIRDLGFGEKQPEYQAWKFKDEAPLEERPTEEKDVHVNFSSGLAYQANFVYDREKNVYKRSNGNTPHTDKNTGNQIEVKNVIVQKVAKESSGGEKGRILISIEGEGDAVIFRDGKTVEAKWKKPDRKSRTLWYDSEGKEIELDRGNTWVCILPGDRKLEYK